MTVRNLPRLALAFVLAIAAMGAVWFLGLRFAHASPDAAPAIVDAVGSGSGAAEVAAAPAVLPDPVAAPAESVSLLVSLWKSGAFASLLIVALYFAALLAGRWVGWLKGSKRRAAFTGSTLALLATLAEPASRGTTPTLAMILAGLGTAIALFVKMDGATKGGES